MTHGHGKGGDEPDFEVVVGVVVVVVEGVVVVVVEEEVVAILGIVMVIVGVSPSSDCMTLTLAVVVIVGVVTVGCVTLLVIEGVVGVVAWPWQPGSWPSKRPLLAKRPPKAPRRTFARLLPRGFIEDLRIPISL